MGVWSLQRGQPYGESRPEVEVVHGPGRDGRRTGELPGRYQPGRLGHGVFLGVTPNSSRVPFQLLRWRRHLEQADAQLLSPQLSSELVDKELQLSDQHHNFL